MYLGTTPPRQKLPPFRSDAWRKAARGQNCTLRIPEVCNYDTDTTVLAHLRMFGWGAASSKPSDFLGVFACSDCHDALDRRGTKAVEPWEVLRALGETLSIHYKEGRIK